MNSAPASQTSESTAPAEQKRGSLRAVEASNFFLADVQTGLGPFVAAYLASEGWAPDHVGRALTTAGLVTVLLQSPAGWLVDRAHHKRTILLLGTLLLAAGALLLASSTKAFTVYSAQALIGAAGPFLAPTLAAITMGIVGIKLFDRQFGRNQGFNSAGNLFAAGMVALTSHFFGNRAIFIAAALLSVPTIVSVLNIRRDDIDYQLARGGCEDEDKQDSGWTVLKALATDRTLLIFLLCGMLFHLANAAMLPQLGELLAHGRPAAAAPFMSVCIAVTQTIIMLSAAWVGRLANQYGRKPLLLIGFGILPIRAVLYTVFHAVPALLAVQTLDGVANSIFGVVSILVIADRTRGSGRFNLAQGTLATAVGIGAAFSPLLGGILIAKIHFSASFLVLGGVAAVAFLVLLLFVPETRMREA